ncbi:MAG: response regulator [Magnetococcales bacterium]|nr:response regulator [Magnetococcales bacterium]
MSKKYYILGVDDEPVNRNILLEALAESFEIVCVADGHACLQSMQQRLPDLVLMDVKMPHMDGLETCRQIRTLFEDEAIPIIFVSALGSQDERMAGYQAGGDDYLVKPFDEDELLTKINLLLANREALANLKRMAQEARQVAFTAMSSAGEMGELLRFLQDSLNCAEEKSLSERLFATLDSLGLDGILRLNSGGEVTFYNRSSLFHPLEKSVLGHCGTDQRMITFGKSAIFSTARAMLFIRCMPVDDEESYGRIKDALAMLLAGVDARMQALENAAQMAKREKQLSDIVLALDKATREILASQAQLREQIVQRFSQLIQEMQSAIDDTLIGGLTTEQEDQLMLIVTRAEKDTLTLISQEAALEEKLARIARGIQSK